MQRATIDSCPDETHAAGHVVDSWKRCLSVLSIEDVIQISRFMITTFLLIDVDGFMMFKKIPKLSGVTGRLAALNEGMCQPVNAQTQTLCEMNHWLVALCRNPAAV